MSRIFLALLAFAIVFAVLFGVLGFFGGHLTFGVADSAIPAISGVTENTNTTAGPWAPTFAILMVSIVGGLIAAALVWEPAVTRKREAILLFLALIVLAGVSGANFFAHDALINVKAQALLNLLLALVSLGALFLLWDWNATRPFTRAVKLLSIFLLTFGGVLLPLFFTVSLCLFQLGIPIPPNLSTWIEVVSGIIGLVVSTKELWASPKP
ncbi:hypothetical protein [Methyloceanibacter sp.]|uniref:hypothetical protein n=1 Tax=Methyloceanibacter sp. TaxID=1965321 RepID=UPI003D6D8D47